ncbi:MULTISPECIES: hypothetical protein [unclassified Paenibacillus]|uniref:hypothetical protein n=1 Tax=unclassified Paenibacillus TaxID=185978 RepID=UPI0005662EBB|nr:MULTISPECIES: hypothetical protein [unclassified Paenibacillus]
MLLPWIQISMIISLCIEDYRKKSVPAWLTIAAAASLLLNVESVEAWTTIVVLGLVCFLIPLGLADKILLPLYAANFGIFAVLIGFIIAWIFWNKRGEAAPLLFCCAWIPLISLVTGVIRC